MTPPDETSTAAVDAPEASAGAESRPARSHALVVQEIHVRRALGFPTGGPHLEKLVDGINLLHGPNACGKTTSARALRTLLWPPSGATPDPREHFEAAFTLGDAHYRAELQSGKVYFRRDGGEAPPPSPPPDPDRYLLDLSDLLADRGGSLAHAIALELAGGYDVGRAAEAAEFKDKPRTRLKLAESLREAENEVTRHTQAQEDLREQEERLRELKAELDELRDSGRRADGLRAALAHAEARAAAEDARRRLDELPDGAGRLRGDDEAERYAELTERRAKLLDRRQDARKALAAAEAELERLALADGGPSGEALRRFENRAEELEELAEQRDRAEESRAKAEAAYRGAVAEMDPEGDPDLLRKNLESAGLDSAGLGAVTGGLDALLTRSQEHAAGATLARRARKSLGLPEGEEHNAPAPSAPDSSQIRERLRRLDGWLAAAAPVPPWPAALALLLATAVLLAQGYFLAAGDPRWWIAAGAGALLTLLVAVGLALAGNRRARRKAEFLASPGGGSQGVEPSSWKRPEVEAARERLEAAWADAAERERRRGIWQGLGVDADDLEREAAELAAERRRLSEDLGLGPDLSALTLAVAAQRSRTIAGALDALREAEAVLPRLDERIEAHLTHLAEELAPYGYLPPRDLAEVRSRIADLDERCDGCRQTEQKKADAAEKLGDEIEPDLAEVEAERRALLERLELAESDETDLEATLRSWTAALPAYREARDDLHQAEREAERSRREVKEHLPDEAEALLGTSAPDLEDRLAGLARAAEERDALQQRITEIETLVKRARESHDLEAALAKRDALREELAVERERDALRMVGWRLAEHLSRETRTEGLPPVMARARELLSDITRGRYELRVRAGVGAGAVESGEEAVFEALDRRLDQVQNLDQLSTGTRLQLLVAARVAFIEEQERGIALPLVLDEVLAVADPERAEALIRAVAELARRGRQIFCLTAQPEEVSRWEAVLDDEKVPHRKVALGDAARGAEARERPLPPPPPAREPVPSPEGMDRRAYAEALGVPGIDLWARPAGESTGGAARSGAALGGVHLWHLVTDLEALHRLLDRGFAHWGPVEALRAAGKGDAALPGGEEILACAAARARALAAGIEAWRIGRGRPVGREQIEASGAVSERFLDKVSEVADACGGDGRALLAALENKEVKGFLTAKIEELRSYLADRGHLDPEPTLTRAELRAAMLNAVADDFAEGRLDAADLAELLAQLPG